MSDAKKKGKNLLDRALDEVVNPIVDCVDVNGVVQRINVNDAVQRIDINTLVQKIDINALLQKVDINALIQRSDLEVIVAQSSSGVFTGIMDTLRFQIVRVDLFLLQVFSFGQQILPPAPGMVDTKKPYPKTTTQKAVAVQLHYCGIFSKALAFGVDIALLFLVQTLFTVTVEAALKRVNQLLVHWDPDLNVFNEDEYLAVITALNMISTCSYFWIAIALTGQTIGMTIVGVRVVNLNGDKDVSLSRAAIRTGCEVFTVLLWPLAILVGLYRRDGRMPHDIFARTGVIFKWNARMARLREENIVDEDGSSETSMNPQQGSDVDTSSDDGSSNRSLSDKSDDSDSNARKTHASDPSNSKAVPGEAGDGKAKGETNVRTKSASSTTRSVPPTGAVNNSSTRRKSEVQRKLSATKKAKETSNSVPTTIVVSPESTDGGSINTGASFHGAHIRSTNSKSKVRLAIEQGREELQCVHATGITGLLFNPFRSLVLDPSLAVASAVVPPIVNIVPFADGIAANIIRLPFAAAKIGYNLVPFCEFTPQDPSLTDVAEHDISCTMLGGSKAVPQITASESLRCLKSLSQSLGITAGDILEEARFRDTYNDRLSDDLKILQRIQKVTRNGQWREESQLQQTEIQNDINEGSRMVKFATAAYATETLDELQDVDPDIQDIDGMKKKIAQHVGIDDDDVKLLCLSEPGGNRMLLRHFVAVDQTSKSIVLSIKGTLSQTANRSNIKCDTTDFCMGIAHKDLSDIACNIWSVSGAVVENLFTQFENENDSSWRFVVTGHSLGAGAAALLTIKCHVEGLLGNRQVRCFAFASPPVYNLLNQNQDLAATNEVKEALANATAFIYGDDCIPFLSQATVSRLTTQIRTIDDACKRLWRRDRAALATGRTPIPEVLVQQVSRQADITTYFRLEIPASKVVWMRNDQSSCGFNAVGYLSSDLAKHDIYISADMIADDMPAHYETSLECLAT